MLVPINKHLTHFPALYKMVREAAGPDLVVLVEGALQKFVRVTVAFFIFKVREEQINTFPPLIIIKTEDKLKLLATCKTIFSITSFLHQLCSLSSNSTAWTASGSKSDDVRHLQLGFTEGTGQLGRQKKQFQVILEGKRQCRQKTAINTDRLLDAHAAFKNCRTKTTNQILNLQDSVQRCRSHNCAKLSITWKCACLPVLACFKYFTKNTCAHPVLVRLQCKNEKSYRFILLISYGF